MLLCMVTSMSFVESEGEVRGLALHGPLSASQMNFLIRRMPFGPV